MCLPLASQDVEHLAGGAGETGDLGPSISAEWAQAPADCLAHCFAETGESEQAEIVVSIRQFILIP
jgi:hypothetical protein